MSLMSLERHYLNIPFGAKGMVVVILLSLSGCVNRDRDDWLNDWPAPETAPTSNSVKGLIGEKHHF